MRTMPWAALAALCLAACEPALLPSPGFDAQAATDALVAAVDGDALGLGDAATATATLAGTWVLLTDWSTCVLIGDSLELRNYTLSKLEIVQDGFLLRETREDCSLVNTPLLGITTVIPQPALQSGNPMHAVAYVRDVGPGMPYLGGVEVQSWGLQLDDPLGDPLPLSGDDPHVVDSDHDGHPGVSLELPGCNMYVAQRAVMVRTGKQEASGAISGEGSRTLTQFHISDSGGVCGTQFNSISNQTTNRWRMLRVDSAGLHLDGNGDGKVSCAEIVENQTQFAAWLEPNDARCAASKP